MIRSLRYNMSGYHFFSLKIKTFTKHSSLQTKHWPSTKNLNNFDVDNKTTLIVSYDCLESGRWNSTKGKNNSLAGESRTLSHEWGPHTDEVLVPGPGVPSRNREMQSGYYILYDISYCAMKWTYSYSYARRKFKHNVFINH